MNRITKSTYIGLLSYVILSLLIGEFHPFSRAEMYDHFPDSSELIALTDSNGKAIALKEFFGYNIGDLTHNQTVIKNTLSRTLPSEAADSTLGVLLWRQLVAYQKKPLPNTPLQIRRIYYTTCNDKIVSSSKVLYETEQ